MRWLLSLSLLPLFVAPAHASMCIAVPLEQAARESRVVALATIASASTSDGLASPGNSRFYSVHYSFLVREVFNGEPDMLPTLKSRHFWDPEGRVEFTGMDDHAVTPGRDVLVFAPALGEAGDIGTCSMSHQHKPTPENLAWLRQWRDAGWPAAEPPAGN